MIFQEPTRSLNPVLTVGWQIAEALRAHEGTPRRRATARAVELLDLVGISEPRRRLNDYPHQLSGGMCQRVMIAMALACKPKLLIADEPTTALDVTIQAQIFDLLTELREMFSMAVLLITHDLGVVAQVADNVAVMYAGKIVETGPVASLFSTPQHPYTEASAVVDPAARHALQRAAAPLDRGPGAEPPQACPRAAASAHAAPTASISAARSPTSSLSATKPPRAGSASTARAPRRGRSWAPAASGRRVASYALRRTFIAIPTLFATSIVIFLMVRLMPGNVIDYITSGTAVLTPQERQQMEHQLGLDHSYVYQYVVWIKDLLTGNLGNVPCEHDPGRPDAEERDPDHRRARLLRPGHRPGDRDPAGDPLRHAAE